jgi:hypothetical protein
MMNRPRNFDLSLSEIAARQTIYSRAAVRIMAKLQTKEIAADALISDESAFREKYFSIGSNAALRRNYFFSESAFISRGALTLQKAVRRLPAPSRTKPLRA